MAYSFNVTDDHKVVVKDGNKKIDEVGPWGDAEGAEYWATEMSKKYDANPTYVYPGEEPSELEAK
jgi:hypothetical protein